MSSNTPFRNTTTLVPGSSEWYSAFGVGDRPVLNGPQGGQYGWAPNIANMVSEHPHIQQQTWCFCISTPALFSRMPAGNILHSLAKSWFETRSREITGLSERIETEFAEQRFSGRVFSVPSGGTRTLGVINHAGVDIEGEVYTNLHRSWSLYGLNDPDLGHPRAVILDDPGDLLIDQISCANIYLEPTRNMRDVAHAALAVGIMPRNTVEIQMRRNKDEAGQMRDINMEYTGLIDFDTQAAKEIARSFLSKLPMYNPAGRGAESGFLQPTAILQSLTDSGALAAMTREAAKVTAPEYML